MEKNPEEKMTPTKMYHIYAKEECLYNNLSETQFKNKWETLKGMVGLMKTDYNIEDLSYEEVELIRQPKEEHSY
tara:strand:+ start:200 stop:421 length:222 start_codon:yes stop_codon:yes gene_type:complete